MARKSRVARPPKDAAQGQRWAGWRLRLALGAALVAATPFLLAMYYAVLPPPISALMVWRLAQGYGLDYRWRALENISPELPQAVITAEDTRFCIHNGIDWVAVQDIVEDAFDDKEKPIRGASTIAMQTAKNLFLWEGRSVMRKLLEAPLALWIDSVWAKRRTIEVYLNIVEWGPGIYGAEAAARKHFGKPAAKLNRQEAALLAAVLPNPIQRSAAKPSRAMRRKAEVIVQRRAAMGTYFDCIKR